MFLTDTANFRYSFYHAQAGTIDRLDVDLITKICETRVATTIDLMRRA